MSQKPDTLHSQQNMTPYAVEQLESHIQARPFTLSAAPLSLAGRGGVGTSNNNSARIAGSALASRLTPSPINANPSHSRLPSIPLVVPSKAAGYPAVVKQEPTPDEAMGDNDTGAGSGVGNAKELGSAITASRKGPGGQGTSDFVRKLYSMLEVEAFKPIVAWGAKNDSFIVKDMPDFTRIVLPQHFKHSNFASFVRQLNKYDFHKVKNPEAGSRDEKTGASSEKDKDVAAEGTWEFRHPNFSIDQKGSAESIKRKLTGLKKPDTPITSRPELVGGGAASSHGEYFAGPNYGDDVALLKKQVTALTNNQRQIEVHLNKFSAQYHALMADLLGQHRAIAAQDAFTATTLQYMIGLEARLMVLTDPMETPSFPPSREAQQLISTYSELSRARYDKMTETTRRAEALGLMINGTAAASLGSAANPYQQNFSLPSMQAQGLSSQALGMPPTPLTQPNVQQSMRVNANNESSPADSKSDNPSPEGSRDTAIYVSPISHLSQPSRQQMQPSYPGHVQHLHPQQLPPLNPSPQHAYYPSNQNISHLSQGQQANLSSPTPTAASLESNEPATITSSATNPAFANLGEIRLGTNRLSDITPSSGVLTRPSTGLLSEASSMSYFPLPGSTPIRPSTAITPGALMVSTSNGSQFVDGLESLDNLTPTGVLTQQNTSSNKQSTSGIDGGKDIAAFAAALRGGQSSTAVRSALTSQPMIVRRATYIPGWSQAPRVLLVEDDAVCRNLTTKFLQLFGCSIDVAVDGVDAVNKMQNGVYDICMMDISMPNLDGVSATHLIRQFDAMTPIISMTGNSRPDEVLTYFSHGMNDVLPKPFTKEGMLSMLEKHLLHLKQIHQNPDMAPDTNLLEKFDPENFDASTNPFSGLGISNEDFQALLSGLGSGKSPGYTPPPSTSLGKRAVENIDTLHTSRDMLVSAPKRTRFQDS